MQPPLLVLPGALGVADGGGAALDALGERRRVAVFSYGSEERLDELLERALALVPGAEEFDLLGLSVGGWFAQCLAAREPRVRKLVIAHGFALAPRDAWRFSLSLKIWPLLPRRLFVAAAGKRAELALGDLAGRDPARYEHKIEQVRTALAEAGALERLAAQQRVLLDSLRGASSLARCPILIVEGSDDPILKPAVRERLAQRYPDARRVALERVGHAAPLVAPLAFAGAVEDFLGS